MGMFLGLRSKKFHNVVLNGIVLGALGTASAYVAKMAAKQSTVRRQQYYNMYAYMPKNEDK